ncbi:uncharacterized protein G2W53_035672 [Senna tora]|uniref:Uncharacterized protein n=1 Tax=Senna tora TaxID=362788 RepID=A0A834SS71_9FABA|nr:uncharacterized protein G2W53_035672 [Senna tora]
MLRSNPKSPRFDKKLSEELKKKEMNLSRLGEDGQLDHSLVRAPPHSQGYRTAVSLL